MVGNNNSICNWLEDSLFNSKINCIGKRERVTKVIYSDVSVGVGLLNSLWEQWSAAFLDISVCLMTIRFPSSLILFFLDSRLIIYQKGKGVAQANKHVTQLCFLCGLIEGTWQIIKALLFFTFNKGKLCVILPWKKKSSSESTLLCDLWVQLSENSHGSQPKINLLFCIVFQWNVSTDNIANHLGLILDLLQLYLLPHLPGKCCFLFLLTHQLGACLNENYLQSCGRMVADFGAKYWQRS